MQTTYSFNGRTFTIKGKGDFTLPTKDVLESFLSKVLSSEDGTLSQKFSVLVGNYNEVRTITAILTTDIPQVQNLRNISENDLFGKWLYQNVKKAVQKSINEEKGLKKKYNLAKSELSRIESSLHDLANRYNCRDEVDVALSTFGAIITKLDQNSSKSEYTIDESDSFIRHGMVALSQCWGMSLSTVAPYFATFVNSKGTKLQLNFDFRVGFVSPSIVDEKGNDLACMTFKDIKKMLVESK